MLKIEKNSRQIPKTKEICANKKYYDILYSYLQVISDWDEKEGSPRLFSANDVKFTKLAEIFGLSRQTVSNKFKNLIDLGLVEKIDSKTYKLNTIEENQALLIQYPVLKLITDTLSENSINTYVWLFNEYYRKQCNSFIFTLEQIKNGIGICSTTRSNDDIITNILYVLQKIGLIDYELTAEQQDNTSFQNIKTVYRLNWLKNTVK